jgi:hypothetical protein
MIAYTLCPIIPPHWPPGTHCTLPDGHPLLLAPERHAPSKPLLVVASVIKKGGVPLDNAR